MVNIKIIKSNKKEMHSNLTHINNPYDVSIIIIDTNKLKNIDTLFKPNYFMSLFYNYTANSFSDFINLKKLYIINNKINNIELLKTININSIRVLDLSNNLISSIEPILSLIKLRSLNISHNPLDNINNIEQLNKLEQLYIDDINLDTLNDISTLYKLKILSFNDNNIYSIENIKLLTNIEILSFDNNNVNDLFPLIFLNNLRIISFQNNNVEFINNITDNPNIEIINCRDNNGIYIDKDITSHPNIKKIYTNTNNIISKDTKRFIEKKNKIKINIYYKDELINYYQPMFNNYTFLYTFFYSNKFDVARKPDSFRVNNYFDPSKKSYELPRFDDFI